MSWFVWKEGHRCYSIVNDLDGTCTHTTCSPTESCSTVFDLILAAVCLRPDPSCCLSFSISPTTRKRCSIQHNDMHDPVAAWLPALSLHQPAPLRLFSLSPSSASLSLSLTSLTFLCGWFAWVCYYKYEIMQPLHCCLSTTRKILAGPEAIAWPDLAV